MKKIVSLIFICVGVLCFTACGDNSSTEKYVSSATSSNRYALYNSSDAVSEAYGISFSTTEKEYPVGTEKIITELHIRDDAEYALGCCEDYQVEKYDEITGAWFACAYDDELTFEAVYDFLSPGHTLKQMVKFEYFLDITPGKYRVVKKVELLENTDPVDDAKGVIINGKNGVVLCAEFTVK